MTPLEILWQDEQIVAVHKPAGLLVHRSAIDRHAEEFALQKVRDQLGFHLFPVHRLDRPTSGALLFARSPESARFLCQQFAQGKVEKTYLSIVRGIPKDQHIDYPLREEDERRRRPPLAVLRPAQAAQTDVRCLATCEVNVSVDRYPTSRYALVEAKPLTGRRHQLRRHLRHIGHPIIGDVTHGSGKHNRYFAERFGFRRLYLACRELTLTHPKSLSRISIRCALAPEFSEVLDQLGWSEHV